MSTSTVNWEHKRDARNVLSPFFGNDRRADLFIKLFWSDKLNSINQTNPEDITSKDAVNFMRSAQFLSDTKKDAYTATTLNMEDDDVHYQFTDFIINVANFHRLLDTVSGLGMISKNAVTVAVSAFLAKHAGTNTLYGQNKTTTFISEATDTNQQYAAGRLNTAFTAGLTDGGVDAMEDLQKLAILFTGLYTSTGVVALTTNITNVIRAIVTIMVDELWTDVAATIPVGTYDALKRTKIENQFKINITSKLSSYFSNASNFSSTGVTDATSLGIKLVSIATQLQSNLATMTYDTLTEVISKIEPFTGFASGTGDVLEAKKVIWNDIILKWNMIDGGARDFFDEYVKISPIDGSNEIRPGNLDANSDMSKYRINLRKTGSGEPCPKFINIIPNLYARVQNVWYTSKAGIKRVPKSSVGGSNAATAQTQLLKDLYCGVFRNIATGATVGTNASTVMNYFIDLPAWKKGSDTDIFMANVNHIIKRMIFEVQARAKKGVTVDEDEDVMSLEFANTWVRRKDPVTNGFKYVMKDKRTGAEIQYGEGDEATKQIMVNSNMKCYSTMVKLNGEQCDQYMYQCLLSNDAAGIDKCINFWSNKGDIYTNMKEEIKQMHPLVAIKTLQRFGFKTHEVYDDEAGRKLIKVESFSHWVDTVVAGDRIKGNTKSAADVLKVITSNKNLTDYLKLVIQYVNANPEVLNTGFVGATVESKGKPELTAYQQRIGLKIRRDPLRPEGKIDADYRRLAQQIHGSRPTMPLRAQMGFPGVVGLTGVPQFTSYFGNSLFQTGGLYGNTYLRRQAEGKITGAAALIGMIEGLIANLKRSGKTIDQATNEEINKFKEDLIKTEYNIMETEMYLEEYKNIIDTYHQYDQQVVSMDDIKKMVRHYQKASNKLYSGEKYFIELFGTLADLASDRKSGKNYQDM